MSRAIEGGVELRDYIKEMIKKKKRHRWSNLSALKARLCRVVQKDKKKLS